MPRSRCSTSIPIGLDVMDRKLLLAVIDKFGGGPVGVDNLAAAISEERDTIEDVLEPFLIQRGISSARRAGASRPSRPGDILASPHPRRTRAAISGKTGNRRRCRFRRW